MSELFDSDPERNPFEYDLRQPEYSGEEAAPPPDPGDPAYSPEGELLNDVTQHYLNEIGAKPLFSPTEEAAWARRARGGVRGAAEDDRA